jgi:hypothetical protein
MHSSADLYLKAFRIYKKIVRPFICATSTGPEAVEFDSPFSLHCSIYQALKGKRSQQSHVQDFEIKLDQEIWDSTSFPDCVIHFTSMTKSSSKDMLSAQALMSAGRNWANKLQERFSSLTNWGPMSSYPYQPGDFPLQDLRDDHLPSSNLLKSGQGHSAWVSRASEYLENYLNTRRSEMRLHSFVQLLEEKDNQFLDALARTLLLTSGAPPNKQSLLNLRYRGDNGGKSGRNIFVWREMENAKPHVLFVLDCSLFCMLDIVGKCFLHYCAVVRPVFMKLQEQAYPSSTPAHSLQSLVFVNLKQGRVWTSSQLPQITGDTSEDQKESFPNHVLLQRIIRSLTHHFLTEQYEEAASSSKLQETASDIQANHQAGTRLKHYGISQADLGGNPESIKSKVSLIEAWQSMCKFS